MMILKSFKHAASLRSGPWLFFSCCILIDTVKKGQKSRGRERERGEDMTHRAAGQTQTWAGCSQPYVTWSPAQHTERPFIQFF